MDWLVILICVEQLSCPLASVMSCAKCVKKVICFFFWSFLTTHSDRQTVGVKQRTHFKVVHLSNAGVEMYNTNPRKLFFCRRKLFFRN